MQEKYGALLPDVFVFALIKFRCTNHRLWMEGGRQQNLPREDKKCMKCYFSTVADDFHFRFECPANTDVDMTHQHGVVIGLFSILSSLHTHTQTIFFPTSI